MSVETHVLAGKVALVTGGSRGIGAAIVRRLAQEGAAVAFTYSNAQQQAETLVQTITTNNGRALSIRADSADPAAVQAAVDETVREFGQLDILVTNAGILRFGTIEQFSIDDFDAMINVNVRGTFAAIKAAAPHLGHGGRIITIGSIVADKGSAGSTVYSLTKGAIASFVRGLAHEMGPRGITVNNVQPGPTLTDMNPADSPHVARLKTQSPVGRFAEADEIAGMVAYVASPSAGYVNGASLTIDGGFSI